MVEWQLGLDIEAFLQMLADIFHAIVEFVQAYLNFQP